MAGRRRFAAVIALGVVIRGETAHFDHICTAAATGLTAVSLQTGVPCTFGVLTTEDRAQAEARAGGDKGNAGIDAADAAVVMINLLAESR
jgi:6,7-dimethyl-8-ribityllumazine synthase